jgi:hypothetical protein
MQTICKMLSFLPLHQSDLLNITKPMTYKGHDHFLLRTSKLASHNHSLIFVTTKPLKLLKRQHLNNQKYFPLMASFVQNTKKSKETSDD